MMSRQQTTRSTRSCNMASTLPDPGQCSRHVCGHAEQKHYHHALLCAPFVRGGSCATACGTSANSSRFTLVVRRLPGNGAKGIGETESPGSRARSQHLTTMGLTPVHHAASRPSNRQRIGSGCSAYMTLDSTYLRCPPVSCNFRAPSATQLALHHRRTSINYYCSALHEHPGRNAPE
jgi:hypothetical protein